MKHTIFNVRIFVPILDKFIDVPMWARTAQEANEMFSKDVTGKLFFEIVETKEVIRK